MGTNVNEVYGNRLRVRACGLLVQEQRLLMVNHLSLTDGDFWSPPGGGILFAEPAAECLKREFQEETGLEIGVQRFLFATEFIQPPLHALELFFAVTWVGGTLRRGLDPEMKADRQIIHDVRFLAWEELQALPPHHLHGVFRQVRQPADVLRLSGYLNV
jgi:8-oxo-dGTP diphosphatase